MTLQEVENRIRELNRNGGAFYAITALTTPKLLAKSRVTKQPTDFSVSIRAKFTCKLGVSYENIINNRLEKMGEERNFEAQKPFGKHYITGSKYLLTADKDESKHYLAVDKITSVQRIWYINGREASKEEVEMVQREYMPTQKPNKFGVSWRTYGLESILSIN